MHAVQVSCAWCLLAVVDAALRLASFSRFYKMMERWPTIRSAPASVRATRTTECCAAVDRARSYYFKHVLCLQSAAATVSFLRLRGVQAQLVIGARTFPFCAHAWAEVDGQVVMNAHPALETPYRVIARC
jgi:hypothetical protein